MTIYQFLAADEQEQIEGFWSGVFIGERIEDGYRINYYKKLFQVHC